MLLSPLCEARMLVTLQQPCIELPNPGLNVIYLEPFQMSTQFIQKAEFW
jgi:hypothetical protein